MAYEFHLKKGIVYYSEYQRRFSKPAKNQSETYKKVLSLLKRTGRRSLSYSQIGVRLGISKQRVGQIAKREGIKRPKDLKGVW